MIIDSLKKILIPEDPLSAIRLLFSLFSVLALFKYAVDHSYSIALEMLIQRYESILSTILFPITPIAQLIAEFFGTLFNIDVQLKPHWRHVFVLMGVYFLSRVKGSFDAKLYTTAYFRMILGLTIAFIASVAAGSPVVFREGYLNHAFIPISAIIGMLFYEVGLNIWYASFFRKMQAKLHARAIRTWVGEFFALSVSDIQRAVIAAVIIFAGLFLPAIQTLPLPGLLLLGFLMFFYGCFWMFWAWVQTHSNKKNGESIDYWSNSDAIVGRSMVSIFGWAASVILLDAGSQLLLT